MAIKIVLKWSAGYVLMCSFAYKNKHFISNKQHGWLKKTGHAIANTKCIGFYKKNAHVHGKKVHWFQVFMEDYKMFFQIKLIQFFTKTDQEILEKWQTVKQIEEVLTKQAIESKADGDICTGRIQNFHTLRWKDKFWYES